MKSVVPFEKARTTAVALQGEGDVVRAVRLHNEPADMVLDWAAIQCQDKFFDNVRGHLGKVFNYHADSLHAGPETALMRHYAARYEHRNGIVLMQ